MSRGTAAPPQWTLAVAPAALLFMLLAGSLTADLDMFHEMALIREALQTGQLARDDVYAYTPTVSPVVHHEWGTGAVLYFAVVVAGLGGTGVLALRFLLFIGVAVCCYRSARGRGADGLSLAILAPLAIALMAVGTTPVRAQLFTFLFLACLLVLLEWDRHGNRWWPALWLPLYVIWLNMHGGFVVGAGIVALYAIEQFGRRMFQTRDLRASFTRTGHLFLMGLAMAVLPLLNPYGWEYIPYLWHALSLDRPLVAEWAPLWDPRVQREYVLIFAVSLLLLVYGIVRARNPLQLPGLLLVLVAAVMATRSQRLLPVYAIVWISCVPAYLASTPLRELLESYWRRFAVPVSAILVVGSAVLFGRAVQLRFWELQLPAVGTDDDLVYPVGAVDYLASHEFSGNLMTPFNAGAFVSWRLYPEVKVGMDSRYEVAYPPAATEENVRLYSGGTGWAEVLDSYPTDALLVRSESPLIALLSDTDGPETADWRMVYRDDGYAIFAREHAAASLPFTDRTGETIVGRFP